MNRPSYKELWSDEYKDRDEQLQWIRNAVNGNAKFRNSEPPYSEEEELARKIMQMHARIAELEDWAYNIFETNNSKDSPNDTQTQTIVYGKERER